jgi:hypothetical protein
LLAIDFSSYVRLSPATPHGALCAHIRWQTMSSHDHAPSSGHAAEYLSADLVGRRFHPAVRVFRHLSAFALSAFGFGGEDALPGFELVVTRLDTGAEVLRTPVGQFEEATRVLTSVRDDMARLSVEQFFREWRVIDDRV